MAADPYLYRITYTNGKVKYGHRRVLGPVLGAWRAGWGYRVLEKVERTSEPVWEDVTELHMGPRE